MVETTNQITIMTTINLTIVIVLAIVLLAYLIEILWRPRLDYIYKSGIDDELILWYNGRTKRKYFKLTLY